MVKKKYYTWTDVEQMCTEIVTDMYSCNWKPDYIVGITRGGNVPATIISNMTGIRCESIKVSLRDNETGKTGDSVAWMADDAYGVLDGKIASGGPSSKRILIVDDINDSGETFHQIMDDIKRRYQHGEAELKQNIKTATLWSRSVSNFHVDFTIRKIDTDEWIIFPWEKG